MKAGKDFVHSRGYVILREYAAWEKDEANKVAVSNLLSVLSSEFVAKPPPPGCETTNEVEIPEDIQEQLEIIPEDIQEQLEIIPDVGVSPA